MARQIASQLQGPRVTLYVPFHISSLWVSFGFSSFPLSNISVVRLAMLDVC